MSNNLRPTAGDLLRLAFDLEFAARSARGSKKASLLEMARRHRATAALVGA